MAEKLQNGKTAVGNNAGSAVQIMERHKLEPTETDATDHAGKSGKHSVGILNGHPYRETAFLVYSRTNEDISAIVKGMEIQSSDKVLAVCGAGDFAFAALSLTPNVKGVDINSQQVAFASGRIRMLHEGDYYHFFGLDNLRYESESNKFLSEKNIRYLLGVEDGIRLEDINFETQQFPRLKSIMANASGLFLECGNFYDVLSREAGEYNKIYLSNIFTSMKKETMKQIIESLQLGAVIYASGNFRLLLSVVGCGEEFDRRVPLNQKLTSIARASEGDFWKPEVYMKVR